MSAATILPSNNAPETKITSMIIPEAVINAVGPNNNTNFVGINPAPAAEIQPVIDALGTKLFTMNSPSGIPLFYYIFLNYRRYRVAKPKIWHIYADQFKDLPFTPFDTYKDSSVSTKILVQKEGSCGSDAVYNILFECEALRRYFYNFSSIIHLKGPNRDLCVTTPAGNDPQKYSDALTIAQQRYDWMKSKEVSITPRTVSASNSTSKSMHLLFPRSNSVKNNLWKNPHRSISYTPSGADSKDMTLFLHKLLGENILKIPGLPVMDAIEYDRDNKQFPDPIPIENVVAFIVTLANAGSGSDMGHFVSFYKNGDQWFIADNDVGYVHEVADSEWVTKIFWPRLMYMMEHYKTGGKYTNADPMKSIYVRMLSISDSFIKNQYITPGERFYPNINPDDIPDANHFATVWYPAGVMPIFYTEGTNAAAGAATAGGSRTRRNRRRKLRKTRRS